MSVVSFVTRHGFSKANTARDCFLTDGLHKTLPSIDREQVEDLSLFERRKMIVGLVL